LSKGLRLLVAVTCVAVLAAIGYWSWKALDSEARARTEAAAAEELRVMRSACATILRQIRENQVSPDVTVGLVAGCINDGYFSILELNRAGRGDMAQQLQRSGLLKD
jgi:hypothetical protein